MYHVVLFQLEKAHSTQAESCVPWDIGAGMGRQAIVLSQELPITMERFTAS